MLTLNPLNSTTITITANSRPEFSRKVEELLLSPPDWVSHYVQKVREFLDAIPSELPHHGIYTHFEIKIELTCTKSDYKLSLKKEATPIERAQQILQEISPQETNEPSTSCRDSISQDVYVERFLSLQPETRRLAQKDSSPEITVGNGFILCNHQKVSVEDFLERREMEALMKKINPTK